ncbi:MAG: RNA 2',3'-cyclic phosphodiesterase, partial [Geodermatophilaceae bacterium]|nr:RNA 2',3'-cyclic phosphodiesterase [Geodermatophilaceae bacterium]
ETDARPFRAHLTVARWRRPERPDHGVLAGLSRYQGPSWNVEEIVLVRSQLGPQPRYERIASSRLPYQA